MTYITSCYQVRRAGIVTAVALTLATLPFTAGAQINSERPIPAETAISPRLDAMLLPDAPSTSLALRVADGATPDAFSGDAPRFVNVRLISAPKYATVIEPEYKSEKLGALGKGAYGMRELFSYDFPVEVLISAGISHGANNDPLYGTNREAFAQRVGAAGARQASQIVLSDVLMAPLLHEDPRYYVMGPTHSTLKRVGYAATRVLFTRSDSGRTTPNLSLLAGYGGSAALTQFYYPLRSRDMPTVLSGYGLSLGGRAIGYELAEFCRFFGSKQPRQAYGGFQ